MDVGYDFVSIARRCCRNGSVLFALIILLTFQSGYSQISAGGTPPSFQSGISSAVQSQTMPQVYEQALLAEDEAEEASGVPHGLRFAYAHDVSLGLSNSGTWEFLPNGDRIWRLRFESDGARSIHFLYDQWRLGKTCRLWIYSDDHESLIGAFTADNNWDGTNITGPTKGEAATLEYLVPADEPDQGELRISQVCHAYRSMFSDERGRNELDNYGDACACQQDINCPAGAGWQTHKRAVAMNITGGTRWCSGTMLTNVRADFTPYYLSANHCLDGNQTNWLFMFNYESPSCGGVDGPTNQTVANATQISTWGLAPGSDFVLLRLSAPPPLSYNPVYAGWSRGAVASTGTAAITHPAGDVKMIMTDAGTAVSDDWNNNGFADTHWRINTDVGASEGGSSGGSLMDGSGRVIGQVTGSPSTCCPPEDVYFGKMARNWDGGGTAATRVRDYLDPDNLGINSMTGDIPVAPTNDNCNSPYYIGTGIGAFPFVHSAYTSYSTNDYGAICRTFPGPDNVYYWYSACSTAVTVSLCGGSTWDTGLYVREADCAAGTEVACNDDFCGLQSQLSFNSRPNTYYYIYVDGYTATSYGRYTLNVSGSPVGGPPANDTCPGTPISSLPYSDAGNTCPANNSYPNCIGSTSNDVFYTLNVSTCQTVTVSLCGSGYDTAIGVRTGGACPGALQVACNDDYCGLQSELSFVALAGENYYIIIHGYSIGAGPYTMSVTGVPFLAPNDQCPGTIIAGLPYTDTGSTVCASDQMRNCIEHGGVGNEVFYSYTAPACTQVLVSLCGTTYDSGVEIRTGGACPGDYKIGCDDDGCTYPASQIRFNAGEGVTYYFVIHGYFGSTGTYQLNVSANYENPSNDICSGAKPIYELPYGDIASTTCASNSEPNCWNTAAGREVYYALYMPYNLPCNTVAVSLCGSTFDTVLRIGTGGACPGTTQVVCDDDGLCGLQSSAVFTGTPGEVYYITLSAYSAGYYGVYQITARSACDPESLVVQRVGNDIFLDWAPVVVSGPFINYNVYRSADPTVSIIPANLIATVGTPYYSDPNRALDPALKSFYAVTTDAIQSLTAPEPLPGAISSLATDKHVSPELLEELRNSVIPVYIDPANIQGPNPNKPANAMTAPPVR